MYEIAKVLREGSKLYFINKLIYFIDTNDFVTIGNELNLFFYSLLLSNINDIDAFIICNSMKEKIINYQGEYYKEKKCQEKK